MTTRTAWTGSRWLALLALAGIAPASVALAQEASSLAGRPRTVDERLLTETPKLPPQTSEASKIVAQQSPTLAINTTGRDVAMLVEHAVGMAIESSNLQAIAGPVPVNSSDLDPIKRLRNQSRKLMVGSQTLLGQAAADGRGLAANPLVGRFHSAANLYITTLAGIEPTSPVEMAQVAMINQAVKESLDADHVRQMAPLASGSAALEQLRNHASLMKTEGNEVLASMTVARTATNTVSPNVVTLADRGRTLLAAAEALGRSYPVAGSYPATGPLPAAGIGTDGNPGRFQDNRPEIIGGTYGTGSPRVGTYPNAGTAPGSTLPKAQSEPSPVPNNSNQTTGSTGGLKPR